MKVSDVMRCTLMTVSGDQSVFSLVNWYNNLTNNSRIAYVIDDNRRLLGIVTIYDLIKTLSEPWLEKPCAQCSEKEDDLVKAHLERMKNTPVEEIMRKEFHSVSPDTTLAETIDKLLKYRVTAIAVLDSEMNLIGEISRRIALHVLGNPCRTLQPCLERNFEMPLFNFQGMIA